METRTHNQCGDTIEESQAPDDGCINVRNMLSIEEVKWNLINYDIKLVSYSSTITMIHKIYDLLFKSYRRGFGLDSIFSFNTYRTQWMETFETKENIQAQWVSVTIIPTMLLVLWKVSRNNWGFMYYSSKT